MDNLLALSIITPAYNEQHNRPILYERLKVALESLGASWEWIIVDDHSTDKTFAVVQGLASQDPRVRGVRFSRNFGSHIAVSCALDRARAAVAIIMAADLQDPPERIPELMDQWRSGSQIVWAVRAVRQRGLGFSRLYYWVMRNVVGLSTMPATGADFFLLDRVVIDATRQIRERNASLFALLSWMGFRSSSITYEKEARVHGFSGWTPRKKLRLAIDSFISFSHKPIRWMALFGVTTAMLGFCYAVVVTANALAGAPVEGWSSLMVAVLIIGGGQMLMLGIMGEYLWRALDEARQRPKYLIEDTTKESPPPFNEKA
jgi:dolichol-phosphate mannosyltransferase